MSFPSQPTSLARDYRGIPYLSGIEQFVGGEPTECRVDMLLSTVYCPEANAQLETRVVLEVDKSVILAEAGFQITPDQKGRGSIRKVGGVAFVSGINIRPVYDLEDSTISPNNCDPFSSDLLVGDVMKRASRLSALINNGLVQSSIPGVAECLDNRAGETYLAFFAISSPSANNLWARFHYLPHSITPKFIDRLRALKDTGCDAEFFDLTEVLAR